MKMRISLAASAALVAACATAGAPRQDPELMAAYRGTQAPSIYGLIGARQRLALTSQQVTALDSIAEQLRTTNRRLTDDLRQAVGARPGGPVPQPRDSAQRARFIPVLQGIARNNQQAVRAVEYILTEQQRGIACQIAAENPGGRDGRGGRGMRGGPPGGMRRDMPMEMEGDSAMRGMGRSWPWCREMIRPDSLRPRFGRDSTRS